MRRAAAIAVALAIAAVPRPAPAQSAGAQTEGRQRYERGIDLFGQRDYGGALAEFQRAYQLTPYAVVLFNLGMTYAALGRPVEASDALGRVIAQPGSLSRDRLEQARATQAEQAARIAELDVRTSVDGARIEIDGVEAATSPLKAPLKVKGGPHQVGAVLSGYAPSRKEVDVPAGARTEVRLELSPTDRRLGHLVLHTKVPAARVLVDGEPVGTTPLAASIALLPGPHKIELARAGYQSARTELVVGDGANAEVTLDPEEDAAAVRAAGARLELEVSERDSVIAVDGRSRGPYLGPIPLAGGPHRLRVERGGFATVERDVTVLPSGATRVRVDLEPTPETRAAYVSKARTFRTLGWIGIAAGAALAAGGVVFLVVNQGSKDDAAKAVEDYNASTKPGGACDSTVDGFDRPACEATRTRVADDQSTARGRDPIGWIGLGAGGVVLGAGVVLLLVGDDPGRYDRRPADERLARRRILPLASVSPGRTLLGVTARF